MVTGSNDIPFTNSEDFINFQACARMTLLTALEINEKPVGKLDFTKNIFNELFYYYYDEIGLPYPLIPNVYIDGIESIDYERWYLDDPLISKDKNNFDIPNGFKGIVLDSVLIF